MLKNFCRTVKKIENCTFVKQQIERQKNKDIIRIDASGLSSPNYDGDWESLSSFLIEMRKLMHENEDTCIRKVIDRLKEIDDDLDDLDDLDILKKQFEQSKSGAWRLDIKNESLTLENYEKDFLNSRIHSSLGREKTWDRRFGDDLFSEALAEGEVMAHHFRDLNMAIVIRNVIVHRGYDQL